MSYEKNINLLKIAIQKMGELSNEVVFIGGIITSLYVDQEISEEVRPTEDVDCVIEVHTKKDYREFEKRLLKKGFNNDTSRDAPICRFVFGDILTLDVMPDDKEILGFSNEWYKEGIKNKIAVLVDNKEIAIFQLPYFIAAKIKAFHGRGSEDPRLSWDLEDIIFVLEGLHEDHTPKELKDENLINYLKKFFKQLNSDPLLIEAKNSFLGNDKERISYFDQKIKDLFSL